MSTGTYGTEGDNPMELSIIIKVNNKINGIISL